ncbi:unnamed protein product [Symbiodinium natans]|uniref:RRM domain-containing protein n=1 Tax=Symbiodinium natans TaxID=878477 RepID=A0A812QSX5_9DINO|nr:unnamed protein product [Symbiodinium natans]
MDGGDEGEKGSGKGKGYGKGYWGGWGYPMMMPFFGKGKGKGLRGFANEKKVWIGGLPDGPRDVEKNKKLKEHMAQAGECIFAEIIKGGAGGAAFKNPEDVPKAIAMLNGSSFDGNTIQVDVWQRKTPETPEAFKVVGVLLLTVGRLMDLSGVRSLEWEGGAFHWSFGHEQRLPSAAILSTMDGGGEGEKGAGKGYKGFGKGYWGGWGYPMMMPFFGKGKGKGLRGFANEKKVWIGGLPDGPRDVEKNKKLKEHMAQAGECIFAEIIKGGAGGAAFKNPEDVPKAIAMLNGSSFDGNTIQVDVWQRKTPETPEAFKVVGVLLLTVGARSADGIKVHSLEVFSYGHEQRLPAIPGTMDGGGEGEKGAGKGGYKGYGKGYWGGRSIENSCIAGARFQEVCFITNAMKFQVIFGKILRYPFFIVIDAWMDVVMNGVMDVVRDGGWFFVIFDARMDVVMDVVMDGWGYPMMMPFFGKGKGKGLRGSAPLLSDLLLPLLPSSSFPNEKSLGESVAPPDVEKNKPLERRGGGPCGGVSGRRLKEHMAQAGECVFAEINRSGIGGAAFKTPEDAFRFFGVKDVQKAVAMLNGSAFEGHTLQARSSKAKTGSSSLVWVGERSMFGRARRLTSRLPECRSESGRVCEVDRSEVKGAGSYSVADGAGCPPQSLPRWLSLLEPECPNSSQLQRMLSRLVHCLSDRAFVIPGTMDGGGEGEKGAGKGGYKGFGKGYWGGWGYPMMMPFFGKGKGKGLRGFANEKKVWIGGLPDGPRDVEKNKKLKEHMSQAGECVFAEIIKGGAGGAAFKNPEDVPKAIAMLNGSSFDGSTIQVDVWQRKTPEAPPA